MRALPGARRACGVAGLVCAAALAGCSAGPERPGLVADAPADVATRSLATRSEQTVYDYCISRLVRSGEIPQSRARQALANLERASRATPSSPFPGRGRSVVSRALGNSRKQLLACDPGLARQVTAIGR